MDNLYKYLKRKVNEAQLEFNTLTDVAEPFFPLESSLGTIRRRRSIDKVEPHYRTRRLIGAVAALAAGTGFILGEPIKDAAGNALSIFNLCHYTEVLERELDQVTKQHRTQPKAFETIQDQNSEKLALLRDEIRLTQEGVEKSKEVFIQTFLTCFDVYTVLQTRSHVINSEVLIAILFSLRNFTYHKLAHCTHTIKPFVQHFTPIEIIFSRSFHLSPRDALQFLLPTQLLKSCKNWLLNIFQKVANWHQLYHQDSKPFIRNCK